ncbi:hypothetical protein KKH43_01160 [Patescibacteria group bacterium]|nr:hypothetical protein [Patescibacteria group bacterium]
MKITNLIRDNTWLIIFLALVLSFVLPSVGVFLQPYAPYLLMLLMFLSCLDIRLLSVLKNIKKHTRGLIILAIIHVFAAVIVLFLKPFLSDELYLGLVIAAVMPSGMSVVYLSKLCKGDPSQALVITSLSNVSSPIIVPALVLLFARTSISIDPISMALTMLKFVIAPLVLAAIVRKINVSGPIKKYGSPFSVFLLFLVIWGVISPVRELVLSNLSRAGLLFIIVSVLVVASFFLAYVIGRSRKEKIAFGISAGYKNFTLSTVTTLALFGPLVALPSVMYTIVDNVFLVPLQLVLKRNSRK